MIAMVIRMALSIDVVGDIFGDELLEIFSILKNVIHGLLSDDIVHLLIAIKLKAHRSEETISVFFHLFDDHALLGEQCIGKRFVAFLPFIVGESMIVAEVLVATVVARHLLLDDFFYELNVAFSTACANIALLQTLVVCAEKFSRV